ncbi:MAG: hypothetical protein LBC27_00245 [Spirochaetaceae bacterium]|nr:hypothetical protein [Spirochaetaceae bacterium]
MKTALNNEGLCLNSIITVIRNRAHFCLPQARLRQAKTGLFGALAAPLARLLRTPTIPLRVASADALA